MGLLHSPGIVSANLRVALDRGNPRGVSGSTLLDLTARETPSGTAAAFADATAGNVINCPSGSTAISVALGTNINHEAWSLMWFARSNGLDPTTDYRHILRLNETTNNGYFYLVDTRQITNSYVLGYQKDESVSSWLSHGFGTNETLWYEGNWHCFCVTHNNKVFKSYRNGVLQATQTQTLNVDTYGDIDELVVNGSATNNFYMGPVYLYASVLTDAEVLRNFNALKGRFGL